jgi:hypothetical protein
VSIVRKDALSLGRFEPIGYSWSGAKLPKWVKKKDEDAIVYRVDIQENNAIDKHTRKVRCVSIYWRFGKHGVGVSESITRKGKEYTESPAQADRETRRYGLADVLAGPIEQSLWEIKSQR